MSLYLDSSVLVAALSPEVFSKDALHILGMSAEVVVSELTVTETRISLIRKRKRGAMSHGEVEHALSELSALLEERLISVVPLPITAFRLAEEIASRVSCPVRAMDSLHVAMAAILNAEMATFDRDQAIAASEERIRTFTESSLRGK